MSADTVTTLIKAAGMIVFGCVAPGVLLYKLYRAGKKAAPHRPENDSGSRNNVQRLRVVSRQTSLQK